MWSIPKRVIRASRFPDVGCSLPDAHPTARVLGGQRVNPSPPLMLGEGGYEASRHPGTEVIGAALAKWPRALPWVKGVPKAGSHGARGAAGKTAFAPLPVAPPPPGQSHPSGRVSGGPRKGTLRGASRSWGTHTRQANRSKRSELRTQDSGPRTQNWRVLPGSDRPSQGVPAQLFGGTDTRLTYVRPSLWTPSCKP